MTASPGGLSDPNPVPPEASDSDPAGGARALCLLYPRPLGTSPWVGDTDEGAFERYIPFKGAIAGKGLGTTGLEAIRTQTLSFIEYWELELSGVRD
ncbi:hypothetical protein T12_15901 [Trichinella patagoniensis]|uniref:Uncharacterized protein n=1 Tax=Trichinella patagoniensis TaxID=990121 RepID=A0A0V0Z5U9_9BILA|nr:hypothetical protein T12_15901 [Trichinella patagoniensis]